MMVFDDKMITAKLAELGPFVKEKEIDLTPVVLKYIEYSLRVDGGAIFLESAMENPRGALDGVKALLWHYRDLEKRHADLQAAYLGKLTELRKLKGEPDG
jgi:hypothetical protein